MFQIGWGRRVRRGSEDGSCLHGKRSRWGDLDYHFKP